jgi:hypothetical protein
MVQGVHPCGKYLNIYVLYMWAQGYIDTVCIAHVQEHTRTTEQMVCSEEYMLLHVCWTLAMVAPFRLCTRHIVFSIRTPV